MENRVMIQLSFTGSSYQRVNEIYRLLDTIGLEVMILPSFDCVRMAVLLIPKFDLKKARDAFEVLRIHANEREVLVIHTENKIGVIADLSMKISRAGVSINYAFLAHISLQEAFLILGCSDNKLAMRALDGKPAIDMEKLTMLQKSGAVSKRMSPNGPSLNRLSHRIDPSTT